MSGLSVTFTPDLTEARRLHDLGPAELEEIVFAIGEMMVTQARTRIADEKRGPEGEAWAPWSAAYAATRSAQHSLLVGEGNPGLMESITNHSRGMEAIAGTDLPYGAVHQFGSEDGSTPARPYLGLSDENRREIEDLVAGDLRGMLQ